MPTSVRAARALALVPAVAALAALGALGALAACAKGTAAGASADQRATSRGSAVITAEEVAATRAETVLEVVQRLRPAWLRSASARSPVRVYVNGAPRGRVEALRQLRAEDVQLLRRLSPAEAQTRYGPGLLSGVIEIETKAGRG